MQMVRHGIWGFVGRLKAFIAWRGPTYILVARSHNKGAEDSWATVDRLCWINDPQCIIVHLFFHLISYDDVWYFMMSIHIYYHATASGCIIQEWDSNTAKDITALHRQPLVGVVRRGISDSVGRLNRFKAWRGPTYIFSLVDRSW